jgi:hypothetical protein
LLRGCWVLGLLGQPVRNLAAGARAVETCGFLGDFCLDELVIHSNSYFDTYIHFYTVCAPQLAYSPLHGVNACPQRTRFTEAAYACV